METLTLLGPVAWYVFVMAGTPGPNNAMLAASGMNFGLVRTLPHIAGICVGITLLMMLTGLGLGVVFATVPEAQMALAVVGSAYLLYLAWRIGSAAAPVAAEGARPIGFWEAFIFQFLNPKGWVMALQAALLMPEFDHVITKAVVLGVLALTVGCMPMAVWTIFGIAIARLFEKPRYRRIINWSFAALLLATIPFMFTVG